MNADLATRDYGFSVKDSAGHHLTIDIPEDQGGNGTGFRPMQLLLAALSGCSGVDMVNILKKQRQDYETLNITVDGEREKDKDLAIWETVEVVFTLTGNVDAQKVYRAAALSIDKYCTVAETLRRAGGKVNFKVIVNGEEVKASL